MSDWRPIETAPRDGKDIILGRRGLSVIALGRWNDDRYSRRTPRPFWDWGHPWGIYWSRENPPTNWMPLPDPPEGGAK